jgi:hypothetical protein
VAGRQAGRRQWSMKMASSWYRGVGGAAIVRQSTIPQQAVIVFRHACSVWDYIIKHRTAALLSFLSSLRALLMTSS